MEPEDNRPISERIAELRGNLLDTSLSMERRYRCVFTLRSLATTDAIAILIEAFLQEKHSHLLKHEIAYVLGQIKNPYAIPFLSNVLADTQENAMVRHEAGEALGAIGVAESLPILQKYSSDPVREVAETCQIAIDRIKYFQSHDQSEEVSMLYASVDPAPSAQITSTQELKEKLLNTNLSLFERYRALFALRDKGDDESVAAMAASLQDDSALFRHEVAFVMGQLRNSFAVDSLTTVLQNNSENPMVRHEAAEALGAIASSQALPLLNEFAHDSQDVVRESCEVALDIHKYFNSDQFQYADGLLHSSENS